MARPSESRRRVAGASLRIARKARGLTQEQLARILDVRLATISDREHSADVAWEVWLSWAMALGMSAAEADDPPQPPLDAKPGDG